MANEVVPSARLSIKRTSALGERPRPGGRDLVGRGTLGPVRVLSIVVLAACSLIRLGGTAQAQAPNEPSGVLLASSDPAGPALAEALDAALLGRGAEVLVGPDVAPGASPITRAANAQSLGRLVGASMVLWVEEGAAGASTVHAVATDGDRVRHAPFAGNLATVDPSTFALVAASLLDELRRPPARVRVRVRVEVEGEGIEIDAGSASVSAPDGRRADAALDAAPLDDEPAVIEPAPPAMTEPLAELAQEPIVELPPTGPVVGAPVDEPPGDRRVLFGADFVPYVGTSSWHRGRDSRALSLGLAWAHAREMRALALSLGLNTTTEGMGGLVAAGLGNIARADSRGLLVASGFNWVSGHMRGVQGAAGFNVATRGLRGAQLASGVNVVRGAGRGVQLAAGVNVAAGSFVGVQASAGGNVTTGRMRGLQASAGANFARGGRGAQVGSVNVQRGDFDGVQIGLVNISKDADFALGLLNIATEGRSHLEATVSSEGFLQLSLKHGGAHWHYLYSVLGRPFEEGENEALYGLGLGIGARITPTDRVFVDLDGIGHWMSDGDYGNDGTEVMLQARALVGVRLMPRLALVAGLSYNFVGTFDDESRYGTFGETEVYDSRLDGWHVHSFPSVQLGVQVF